MANSNDSSAHRLTRRSLLGAATGAGAIVLAGAATRLSGAPAPGALHHSAPAHAGVIGEVDHARNQFDPQDVLRSFDPGRAAIEGKRTVREWTLTAREQEIEIAPGVMYPGWSYNNRIPGPTLRATEGDLMRVTLVNASPHPHTIHFHGVHPAAHDGVPGSGPGGHVQPGGRFTYEFVAGPAGIHMYHCHTFPLASHISKGLYGAFVVDPREARAAADELVMVMNGFDTNFDMANEVYAVNSIAFAYQSRPIAITADELVRIYLVNITEFDPVNSFHVHGNFFDHYPTGTSRTPSEFTDIVVQGQGQRAMLEMRFPYRGRYMFHAHKTEFAELGWSGIFEVS
jgi:manganese oxidase